jgi:hypothetical protein
MSAFRIPGPLCLLSSTGGLVLGSLASKGLRKAAAKLAARELGPKIMSIVLRRRTARLVGKQWDKAFAHIAEHFSQRTAFAAARRTAGIFTRELCAKDAIEKLVTQAVKKPSAKTISRAFVHGVSAGEPVVIVEREFGHVIGQAFKREVIDGVEQIVLEGDCRVLRVVYNCAGEILSAFPVSAIYHGL